MTYPNAFKGIKKVYLAQILMLIVAILTFVAACVGAVGIQETSSEAVATGSLVALSGVTIVMGVLSVITFIINLVGLSQAAKDNGNFKTAFILTIVGLVLAIINAAVNGNNSGSGSIFETVSNVINVLIVIFVINGIVALAANLNDEKLQKKGKTLLTVITIVMVIALVLKIVGTFVSGNAVNGAAITFAVIGVVAAVLYIVAYIMYLSLLSKAKKSFGSK